MVDLKATQIADRLRPRERDAYKPQRKRVAHSELLSKVEVDKRVLPPTYRNLYERLKLSDPTKAQAFWDKWALDPETLKG